MNIGVELRKERKRKDFTQEDLAFVLGWPPSKISKIENGEQEITALELYEIMQALEAQKIASFIINDYEHPARVLQTN
jgi:transcriptional regulator with XRE-family HTH domain